MRAMNIAATGMSAQQTNVEVIANNIANQGTTGFKRQRAEFQDLLYQTERRGGATSSDSGTIVRSRSRAYSTKRSGTSNDLHFCRIDSWETPNFSAAASNAAIRSFAFRRLLAASPAMIPGRPTIEPEIKCPGN